jgi:adenine deaminase
MHDRGVIAPWARADCLILDNLTAFPPRAVYVGGQQVAAEGAYTGGALPELPPLPNFPTVPAPPSAEALRMGGGAARVVANVVTLVNEQTTLTQLERVPLELQGGFPVFRAGDGLNALAVHTRNGARIAVGVIKNVGLERGAFASSLAHDSHNLLLIGRDRRSMLTAAHAVHAMGGGVAVAEGDTVIARLPLPLFGLLSDAPLADVQRDLAAVEDALHDLGIRRPRPFLTLSIMALSVSPYYKFTDRGVVDTEKRALLPTWETAGD